MAKVYIYVVARDFGFAPNPFHGTCTLATCKPVIRRNAAVGDWIVGMGGKGLKAEGRCIFAMRVTEHLSFNEYWQSPDHQDKRAVRNGSQKMLVGDNIYHREPSNEDWIQSDSHHSRPDGSPDIKNINTDTSADRVLISKDFYYFGINAPIVPIEFLEEIGYKNCRNHRIFDAVDCISLIDWLTKDFKTARNRVSGDPFQFSNSAARYSAEKNKVI